MEPLPTHWWTLPNPILVVVRLDRDWIFDWQALLTLPLFSVSCYFNISLTHIPCSELSFRGPKLGPHHFLILSTFFLVYLSKMVSKQFSCLVSWGCRIHWLHLCRGVRPPPLTSVLDMTLNNLMVRFQQCWSFGECGVPLHCPHSQVHSRPEW